MAVREGRTRGWRGWPATSNGLSVIIRLAVNRGLNFSYMWMWRGVGPWRVLGSPCSGCFGGLQASPVSEPPAKEGGSPVRGRGSEEAVDLLSRALSTAEDYGKHANLLFNIFSFLGWELFLLPTFNTENAQSGADTHHQCLVLTLHSLPQAQASTEPTRGRT